MSRSFNLKKIPFKYTILILVTSSVIVLDQVTKIAIQDHFRLGETVPLIPDFFNFTYVQNQGAAFGLLAEANPAFRIPFFMVIPLVALACIGTIFWRIPHDDFKFASALSLVMGGAVGNLIDRFLYNHVIDFLDFHWGWQYHFPAFNVADSAICIGVGLLMLDLAFQSNRPEVPKLNSKGV